LVINSKSGKEMIPTNKLRFVKRLQVTSRQNGLQKETINVLQQWWCFELAEIAKDPSKAGLGEWRDVPLENEE
jgi:hypothetical protein